MRSRRQLALCCAALVLAAIGLWVSSALPWYRVTAQVPLRGPVPVTFTGSQVWPPLVGLAPVALAAVAALLALGGPARRVLGGVVAAAGTWVVVIAAQKVLGSEPSTLDPGYPPPPSGVSLDALRYEPLTVTAAPWIAVAAGLTLLAAGAWVAVGEHRLPRFGARYTVRNARRREPDQEREWWDALDEGQDPTSSTEPETDPRPGT